MESAGDASDRAASYRVYRAALPSILSVAAVSLLQIMRAARQSRRRAKSRLPGGGPQLIEDALQVGGQGSDELNWLAGGGMDQLDATRVQGLAGEKHLIVIGVYLDAVCGY